MSEPELLDRIRRLAIPPAWRDVWICPHPWGHLQATGIDAAGRKQYLYHERWRERRDQEKFEGMLAFARALPGMRRQVAGDLRGEIVFDYPAKSGQRQRHAVRDDEVRRVIAILKRRRGGSDELLAYREGRSWVDVRSQRSTST